MLPRLAKATLFTLLLAPALAWSQTDNRVLEIDGSSGKYLPTEVQSCAIAKEDALQVSTSECGRANGVIVGEPTYGNCRCEKGGFEESEWLCSTVVQVTCAVSQEVPVAVVTPVAKGSAELALELPATFNHLELLDRAFARRGFALPAKTLETRLEAACTTGWALACRASGWKKSERYDLSMAQTDLRSACSAGDTEGCIALGWALEEVGISTRNQDLFREAARYYRDACDGQRNATACYSYGTILFNNLGVQVDPKLGIKRWEDACKLGEPAACSVLAKVNRTGVKTRADRDLALSYAKKACDLGDPPGCIELALLQDNKELELQQQIRACKLGGVEMCWTLAKAYLDGDRPEPQRGLTRGLLDLACELGNGVACVQAGNLASQDGNYDNAAVRFRQGCAAGQIEGCNGLVGLVTTERVKTSPAADPYAFEVACSKGNVALACSALGLVLLEGEKSLEKRIRARALLRQSCTDAKSPAKPCYVLGDLYETGDGGERDRTLAANYFKWACAQGWGDACHRRGDLLAKGVGVIRNDSEAVLMYQSGCDAGLPTACLSGAIILDEGTEIPRDEKRALDLYDLACNRGLGDGCLRMGNLLLTTTTLKDDARARAAYEAAVRLGIVEGHRRLAYVLWNGIGGKKSRSTAKKEAALGCKLADAIACRGPAFQTAPGQ